MAIKIILPICAFGRVKKRIRISAYFLSRGGSAPSCTMVNDVSCRGLCQSADSVCCCVLREAYLELDHKTLLSGPPDLESHRRLSHDRRPRACCDGR